MAAANRRQWSSGSNSNSIGKTPRPQYVPKATGPVKLRPSLLAKNKEKLREAERNKMGPQARELRSGMFLLEAYLSQSEQVEIIKERHKLGLGPGGLYQPGYKDGAKLRRHMMCLGKDWDPETGAYRNRRAIDDAVTPSIPDRFKVLVDRALKDSQSDVLPSMKPDICIVNFYTNTGKLGLHQDKDDSIESLRAGLPVVSFSIGDSAEFLYGDERDVEKAKKVTLKTGDVLIFGGESRHVFHGVPSISPGSAPKPIIDETGLRPGHLNLTLSSIE
ncbi:hypothetical protein ACLOJK_007733 [Asimina triloba]